MEFLDLEHMYDIRTRMVLKFESECVSDVGQATSVTRRVGEENLGIAKSCDQRRNIVSTTTIPAI